VSRCSRNHWADSGAGPGDTSATGSDGARSDGSGSNARGGSALGGGTTGTGTGGSRYQNQPSASRA